ncbi:MAG: cytochrome c biogenesis protein CcdA [Dehalococcoidia bacterium]
MSDTSLPIVFGAGILSFLSPCVLPLVPVYLANMAGVSVLDRDSGVGFRTPLVHTLIFVAGFTVIFTALGASAGLLGFFAGAHRDVLSKIAGGLLIFFGIFLIASLKIPWLNYQKHVGIGIGSGTGYLRSFLIGSAFALGWTPCVGPILGGILTLAYDSETAWRGSYLLLVYSLGLGIPFIIMSLAVSPISAYLKRFSRYTPLASLVGGVLLIVVGALIYFDKLSRLSAWT